MSSRVWPPSASASRRAIARPRPAPLPGGARSGRRPARARPRSARAVVDDVEVDWPAPAAARMRMALAPGATSRALSIRLSSTWPSRSGEASTCSGLRPVGLEADAALVRERLPDLDALMHGATEVERRGRRAEGVGAGEGEQPVDQAREPRDLVERALHEMAAGGVDMWPRFSSRRRRAASGVRSWCEASATKASWACTSASRRPTISLNAAPARAPRADPRVGRARGEIARTGRRGRLLERARAAARPSARGAAPIAAASTSTTAAIAGEDQPVAVDAGVTVGRRIGDAHGAETTPLDVTGTAT